jgi:hypothetical protein
LLTSFTRIEVPSSQFCDTIKRWEMVFYFGKINYKRGGEVQRLPHLLIK